MTHLRVVAGGYQPDGPYSVKAGQAPLPVRGWRVPAALEQRIDQLVEAPLADALNTIIEAELTDDRALLVAALRKIGSVGHLARGIAQTVEDQAHPQ